MQQILLVPTFSGKCFEVDMVTMKDINNIIKVIEGVTYNIHTKRWRVSLTKKHEFN